MDPDQMASSEASSVFKKDKSGFNMTRVSPSPAFNLIPTLISSQGFIYNNRFRWIMENTMDADQLVSSKAS